jgi:hypothetical protein
MLGVRHNAINSYDGIPREKWLTDKIVILKRDAPILVSQYGKGQSIAGFPDQCGGDGFLIPDGQHLDTIWLVNTPDGTFDKLILSLALVSSGFPEKKQDDSIWVIRKGDIDSFRIPKCKI